MSWKGREVAPFLGGNVTSIENSRCVYETSAYNTERKKEEETMKIFLTGATGVLGKAVIPDLLAGGHLVYALSRSEANTEVLQRLGAKPVPANLFDSQALAQ